MALSYSKVVVIDSAFADPNGTGVLSVSLARPLPRVTSIELIEAMIPKVDDDRFLCIGCNLNGIHDVNTTLLPSRTPDGEVTVPLMAIIPTNHVAASRRTEAASVTALTNSLFVIDDLLVVNYVRWSEPGFFKASFPTAIRSLDRMTLSLHRKPDTIGEVRPFRSKVLSIGIDLSGTNLHAPDFVADSGPSYQYPKAKVKFPTEKLVQGTEEFVYDLGVGEWVPRGASDTWPYTVLTDDTLPPHIAEVAVQIVDANKTDRLLVVGLDAAPPPTAYLYHETNSTMRSRISSATPYDTNVTLVVRVTGEGNVNDMF